MAAPLSLYRTTCCLRAVRGNSFDVGCWPIVMSTPLLRLPTGIFYRPGVKANVLFFDKRPASETPWTRNVWVYDLRTNQHFTLKTNPLTRDDLNEFVDCYHTENRHDRTPTWSLDNPDGRWRAYQYDELMERDKASLDLFWLRDESMDDAANLADPNVIAAEIIDDLRAALDEFEAIQFDLDDADTTIERSRSQVAGVTP